MKHTHTHTQNGSGLRSNLIHVCHVEENLSDAMWRPDTGYTGTFVFVHFTWKNDRIRCVYTCT